MSKHGVTGPAGAALAAIELERRKPRPSISAARVREIAEIHSWPAYGSNRLILFALDLLLAAGVDVKE